jgi:hypothetical protein
MTGTVQATGLALACPVILFYEVHTQGSPEQRRVAMDRDGSLGTFTDRSDNQWEVSRRRVVCSKRKFDSSERTWGLSYLYDLSQVAELRGDIGCESRGEATPLPENPNRFIMYPMYVIAFSVAAFETYDKPAALNFYNALARALDRPEATESDLPNIVHHP